MKHAIVPRERLDNGNSTKDTEKVMLPAKIVISMTIMATVVNMKITIAASLYRLSLELRIEKELVNQPSPAAMKNRPKKVKKEEFVR